MPQTKGQLETELLRLSQLHEAIIEQTIAKHLAELGGAMAMDGRLAPWEELLSTRPEGHLVSNGRREFGRSVWMASAGQYGVAFASLRLFLELSFAAVFFSANEYRRRVWLADRWDFSWSQALDVESGILSPDFINAFNPLAADDGPKYKQLASAVYRSCSQFLHGKQSALETAPNEVDYSESALLSWCKLATDAQESVHFLYYSRYGMDLLPSSTKEVEQTLLDVLAHLSSVQTTLATLGVEK
ncbi:MAG: hypothetical protein QOE73_2652 [Verrucomicrobiota bacterium]